MLSNKLHKKVIVSFILSQDSRDNSFGNSSLLVKGNGLWWFQIKKQPSNFSICFCFTLQASKLLLWMAVFYCTNISLFCITIQKFRIYFCLFSLQQVETETSLWCNLNIWDLWNSISVLNLEKTEILFLVLTFEVYETVFLF